MTFRQYLIQIHTEQTTKSYLRAIEHFLLHSEQKENSQYTDILNYMNAHRIESSRDISALKKYFDYLVYAEFRADHPCRHLKVKRERKQIQHQDLFSPQELIDLLDRNNRYEVLRIRNKFLISLLIFQGLTPANIANLNTKDVDLDNGTVYIKATPKLSRRTLEMKPNQMMIAFKYLTKDRRKLKSKSDVLFISKLGEPISVDTINRILRPLKKLYPDRNLNAQTIRQSVLSNWINIQGIPIEDVQLLSGQKWLSSTEKYKREDEKRKVELINQWFPLK